ncbi:MAG: aldehyde dehydrogenase family protein, partial [Methanoregula sp.]
MEPYPILLGGEKKETQEIIQVRFPYTGELYCTVCQATNNDLKTAVTRAVAGFGKTKHLSTHARAEILSNLADEIHRRAAELVDVMIMEGGKTRKFATTEVARAEVTVRTSAEEVKR